MSRTDPCLLAGKARIRALIFGQALNGVSEETTDYGP
jgi:hypothetical protein